MWIGILVNTPHLNWEREVEECHLTNLKKIFLVCNCVWNLLNVREAL